MRRAPSRSRRGPSRAASHEARDQQRVPRLATIGAAALSPARAPGLAGSRAALALLAVAWGATLGVAALVGSPPGSARGALRGGPPAAAASPARAPGFAGSRAALALLAVAWVATLVMAPLVGSQPVSLGAALRGEPTAAAIFWQLRLPRVLLSLLAGGGLALSGLGFQ